MPKIDVCMMPFALNEATHYTNPTKTLVYMAAGKPVVSTAIQDVVRNFTPVVGVAYTHAEFANAVELAMAQPQPDLLAPVLICGATGSLGRAFARLCKRRGLEYMLLSRQDVDIADSNSVDAALDRFRPWAVINAAGYVRVDDAETDVERCFRENAVGAGGAGHSVCTSQHCAGRIFQRSCFWWGRFAALHRDRCAGAFEHLWSQQGRGRGEGFCSPSGTVDRAQQRFFWTLGRPQLCHHYAGYAGVRPPDACFFEEKHAAIVRPRTVSNHCFA